MPHDAPRTLTEALIYTATHYGDHGIIQGGIVDSPDGTDLLVADVPNFAANQQPILDATTLKTNVRLTPGSTLQLKNGLTLDGGSFSGPLLPHAATASTARQTMKATAEGRNIKNSRRYVMYLRRSLSWRAKAVR